MESLCYNETERNSSSGKGVNDSVNAFVLFN
jgi:hypothetical protein